MKKHHAIIAASIFIIGVIFVFAEIWSHIPARHAAAAGYSYYSSITVTSTASIASGTLVNFPMLVSSTESYWEASSSGGTIQNLCTDAHGNNEPCDLVFATSSANCGTSNLNFETESYVSSTGALVDWVNVPTMSTGTIIYACYDNSSVTADQSHPSSTWNSNYVAVFHLNTSPTGTVQTYDSTANQNNGVTTSTVSGGSLPTATTTGYIDGSMQTATSTSYLQLATNTVGIIGSANSSTFTIEGWAYPYVFTGSEFNVWGDYNGNGTVMRLESNEMITYVYPSNWRVTDTGVTAISAGKWVDVAETLNGSTFSNYANGALLPNQITTSTNGIGGGTTAVKFKIDEQGEPAGALGYGAVDEVRISKVALSSQWLSTEYYNEASTSQFYAVGAETPLSGGSSTATSTWIATSSNSWSVPTNWSAGSVPTSNTFVLFSGSSTLACTIDTSTAVQAFTIVSGYTGTITQSSTYSLTIASSGFSQVAGTFTGGTGTITDSGPFSLTGGTFNGTKGELYLYGATTTFSGGTFNSSGTTIFGSTSTAANVAGSGTFSNLWLGDGTGAGNINLSIATGTTLTVQSSTVFAPSSTQIYLSGGGAIAAQGNILLSGTASGTAPTSTFNLTMSGSSNQLINDQGFSSSSHPFYLPSLTVNKTGGIALVSSSYLVVQSTTIASGEFRIASNTAPVTFIATSTFAINSGGVLSDYPQASSTVTFGSSITNNGVVFFDGAGVGCLATPVPNYVAIRSTVSGTQRTWSGSGTFIVRYASVQDQTSSVPISDLNGTSTSNVGGGWSFTTGPQPQLVQSAAQSTTSGSKSVTVTMPFWPRTGDLMVVALSAENESIAMATDTAGNTYTLIASSTFGIDTLALYYAKNVSSTQASFSVTGDATSSSAGNFISVAAFEYTGVAQSSTFNGSSSNTGSGTTALTSNVVTGQTGGQIFFGASSFTASTTATSGSGWTPEVGITNNNTTQALYTEQIATTTSLTTAATWTSAASTSYGAIAAIFRSPVGANYAADGTIDSATFDTGVASGTQINSVIWQGSAPSTSGVGFQFAVSNSSSGPWNYVGPTGASSYFGYTLPGSSIGPNTPINLGSLSTNYSLLNGYRYFRYRMTLFSDPSETYAPTVSQVIVNWSP